MKLHDNQMKLLHHLARFNLLDYPSCLRLLDTAGTGDAVSLSYAFRPLTKYDYLSKRDNCVSILAKGRALFPDVSPLIAAGGGAAERERVMQVSRMALLMEENDIPCRENRAETKQPYFIPSACWRKIAPGILSTTRFTGMLIVGSERYAVYDIGGGQMDWQVRAESSLFYCKYGTVETMATGMILICWDEARNKVAENIIRQTMWARRQLLNTSYSERNKPTRWSRSPIKLRAQYEHVYLMTPGSFQEDLHFLLEEKEQIAFERADSPMLHNPPEGDFEYARIRYFVNSATDLLKYVYFFSAVKEHLAYFSADSQNSDLSYAICYREKDKPLLQIYPDVMRSKVVIEFEYSNTDDFASDTELSPR